MGHLIRLMKEDYLMLNSFYPMSTPWSRQKSTSTPPSTTQTSINSEESVWISLRRSGVQHFRSDRCCWVCKLCWVTPTPTILWITHVRNILYRIMQASLRKLRQWLLNMLINDHQNRMERSKWLMSYLCDVFLKLYISNLVKNTNF